MDMKIYRLNTYVLEVVEMTMDLRNRSGLALK